MKKDTKSKVTGAPVITDEQLKAALDSLFQRGGWEIPDDAVAGSVARRVEQLQARVDHLTEEVQRLKAEKDGEPTPGQRVDPLNGACNPQKNGRSKRK